MIGIADNFSPPPKAMRAARIAAAIGAIAVIVGWIFSPAAFFRAYLHSWLLWTDVSLGCLGFTMVIHLLGGAWGSAVRRMAESAAMVLPVMAVLFIPIAIAAAAGSLFPWADSGAWHADPLLVHRRPYLNVAFFLARAILYAIVWIGLAWLLWRGSRRNGGGGLYALSGIGMVLYVLTVGLFASTDWILSLEPDYKSTVFGMIIVAGQGVSALCVLIATLALLSVAGVADPGPPASAKPATGRLPRPVEPEEWNDLSTVLLTASMFWCYLVVCQFVVNWMGNDQEQAGWYHRRMSNGWYALSVIMVLLLLVMPFVLLLFRSIKRSPRALLVIAVIMLATRGLDGFSMINASGSDPTPLLRDRVSWLDIVLPIGIGGVWVMSFLWLLGRAPLMVERRPVPQGATNVA